MPRKTFTAGEVLAAADVNTFLMDQSVMTFADSDARGSAIPTPSEGMVTYLEDTDALEVFNGSSFVPAAPASGGGSGNAIINGAFEINQRNFSSTTVSGTYGFDRWFLSAGDGTVTYSSQSFTSGELSVPNFGQPTKYARVVTTGQTLSSANGRLRQQIEGVTNFAGETITISFWAKAASGTPNVSIEFLQNFGSGGSPSATTEVYAGQVALSTSWERKSLTVAIPSISGKTLGTTANRSMLEFAIYVSAGSDFNARTGSLGIQSNTFDFWGVQLEAGSTATDFRRNANSLQGELAACQRYYVRWNTARGNPFGIFGTGSSISATQNRVSVPLPVEMRREPLSVEFGNLGNSESGAAITSLTGMTLDNPSNKNGTILALQGSGLTQFRPNYLFANNSTAAFLAFNAEL